MSAQPLRMPLISPKPTPPPSETLAQEKPVWMPITESTTILQETSAEEDVNREEPPQPSFVSREKRAEVEKTEDGAEPEDWRLSGEVLNTYIVVEQGETIYLIDKHAAHERMHFDRMKEGDYAPMSQTLLEPLVITLPPEESGALLQQRPLLEEFGFVVEEFGGDAFVVRQVPYDISVGETESTLGEIAKDLLSGNRVDPSSARDSLLHTMACKAAIKGGQKNAPEELMPVAQAVMSGQVKYCPHGRPVAITLTRTQLERQFGRA